MKRKQLFEFEDFKWFPDWLRSAITRLIVVLHNLLGIGKVLADLIAPILRERNISKLVDLGSGVGGAMPELHKILQEQDGLKEIQLTMTDLYPSQSSIEKYNSKEFPNIRYEEKSIDATNFAAVPEGLKTMINCFHHMPVPQAKKILASAQANKQPLLIYEMADNNLPFIVWLVFLPISLLILVLMVVLMTPFVKPLTWRQLVFTYLIPIIPIFYAWDGQASMPRIYNHEDMDKLLADLPKDNYTWKKGYGAGKNGKKTGIYLLGLPTK